MNSFVRYVSILVSASMMLSWPAISFAQTMTLTDTVFNESVAELNACREEHKADPSVCKTPTETKKEKEKEKKAAEAQPQQQQQPPQQQPEQQQQREPASTSGSGGNCGDVAANGKTTPANNPELIKNGADTGKDNAPGQGKKEACEQVKGSFDQRARNADRDGKSFGLKTNFAELEKDYQEYMKNRESCLSGQAEANTQCMEGNSPSTSNASTGVGDVLGQVGQNASDTCGKFAKAMDIAKAGLAAFSANCGRAQGECSSSCKSSTAGLAKLIKKAGSAQPTCTIQTEPQLTQCNSYLSQYQAAITEGISAAEEEMSAGDAEAVAGKQKICDKKYSANIGSALQGVMGMLAGMMQGNKCEEETNGTAEQKGTLSDKCILPENASLPECICKINPLTVGCGSAYAKLDASGARQVAGGLTDKANVDPSNKDLAGLDGPPGMQHSELNSGPDGAAAPMGGGSAGLGGSGGGSGGGPGGGDGAGGSGLNTNILGGTSGGGGGSGGMAGGSSDKYRAYLPGGAKDPNKALAGQQAWTKEVTGQAGKSNWEKVKDRYQDNKNSLLNNN